MKVKIYVINQNQPSQYFGLMLAEEGNELVLPYAPTWKTRKGAERYAFKHGFVIVE